jgi:hypothetical protein
MKYTVAFITLVISLIFASFTKNEPVTQVTKLNECDSEIFIRDWEITKPYELEGYLANQIDSCKSIPQVRDQGDNIQSYRQFSQLYNQLNEDTSTILNDSYFARLKYHMSGSYIQIDSLFQCFPDRPRICYATTQIQSDSARDVAIIAGANNGIQIWVNQKQVFSQFSSEDYISGYQYNIKSHLNKGNNFILVKMTHISGDWKFFLKVASLKSMVRYFFKQP